MAKQDSSAGFWGVRDVSLETRKKVKHYAIEHDITIGRAVEELVEKALRLPAATEPEAEVRQEAEVVIESRGDDEARKLAVARFALQKVEEMLDDISPRGRSQYLDDLLDVYRCFNAGDIGGAMRELGKVEEKLLKTFATMLAREKVANSDEIPEITQQVADGEDQGVKHAVAQHEK